MTRRMLRQLQVEGTTMTHDLKPSEYEYRGHWISLVGISWLVFDHRDGDGGELFASESIDDCTAAIDAVLDDE